MDLLPAGVHAQPMGSPPHRPGQNWQRLNYPDGSGSIALPPGWRVNSAQQGSAALPVAPRRIRVVLRVLRPADLFPQAFPLMVEVWQSASISQGEMNRRTSLALLTMKETNRIMQSTAEGRRTTQWHQSLTGMTLRGRWVIEDMQTGRREEPTSEEINALFEQFPGRYRVVPSVELR